MGDASTVGSATGGTGAMKVLTFPGDDKGVGWARMRFPTEAARNAGVDVEIAKALPFISATRKSDGKRVIAPDEIEADVLVFQRPSDPETVALIPALRARGHAVVVDVDDAAWAPSWANRARHGESAKLVARACAAADVVTVSTPLLLERYGGHGRGIVIPNCVPEALLSMPRHSDGLTVGWSGWVGSHPHDLQVTHGGVAEAVRQAGAKFRMVGPGDGVREALGLDEEPKATGGLPINAYHAALGTIDVGIAPLDDTLFNRAKSWLKPLEMTARGAAVVMSPLPEYGRLADEGIGVLAKSRARNWRARVLDLLQDDALRRQLVERGQAVIREHHTYETQGWRWAEAWEHAYRHLHESGAIAA